MTRSQTGEGSVDVNSRSVSSSTCSLGTTNVTSTTVLGGCCYDATTLIQPQRYSPVYLCGLSDRYAQVSAIGAHAAPCEFFPLLSALRSFAIQCGMPLPLGAPFAIQCGTPLSLGAPLPSVCLVYVHHAHSLWREEGLENRPQLAGCSSRLSLPSPPQWFGGEERTCSHELYDRSRACNLSDAARSSYLLPVLSCAVIYIPVPLREGCRYLPKEPSAHCALWLLLIIQIEGFRL